MPQVPHILSTIKSLAKQLLVNHRASVYLYGSRARGNARQNSDWDLIIITEDTIDKKEAFEKLAYPFTEAGWLAGEQITPVIYTQSEWNAERHTAFYLNVQNDAILL